MISGPRLNEVDMDFRTNHLLLIQAAYELAGCYCICTPFLAQPPSSANSDYDLQDGRRR